MECPSCFAQNAEVIPAISMMVAYVILERDHFDMHNRGAAELLKWLEPLAQ